MDVQIQTPRQPLPPAQTPQQKSPQQKPPIPYQPPPLVPDQDPPQCICPNQALIDQALTNIATIQTQLAEINKSLANVNDNSGTIAELLKAVREQGERIDKMELTPGPMGPKGDAGPPGPAGPPGKDGTIPTVPPPTTSSAWSHLVLIADSTADYWPRMKDDLARAMGHYNGLRQIEPPNNVNIGPIPIIVAYQGGTAAKTFVGLRAVDDALSAISRGDYDRFLFKEG